MKANTKKKKTVQIDWHVCAISDKEARNNPEGIIEYRTLGFSKYGFGEIVVIGRVCNANKITNLVNTFGRMLAEGEYFEHGGNHFIDKPTGENEFEFGVVYGEYVDGKKWVQLIPNFEQEIFKKQKEEIMNGCNQQNFTYS